MRFHSVAALALVLCAAVPPSHLPQGQSRSVDAVARWSTVTWGTHMGSVRLTARARQAPRCTSSCRVGAG